MCRVNSDAGSDRSIEAPTTRVKASTAPEQRCRSVLGGATPSCGCGAVTPHVRPMPPMHPPRLHPASRGALAVAAILALIEPGDLRGCGRAVLALGLDQAFRDQARGAPAPHALPCRR
jgi:hypothetical protein